MFLHFAPVTRKVLVAGADYLLVAGLAKRIGRACILYKMDVVVGIFG